MMRICMKQHKIAAILKLKSILEINTESSVTNWTFPSQYSKFPHKPATETPQNFRKSNLTHLVNTVFRIFEECTRM